MHTNATINGKLLTKPELTKDGYFLFDVEVFNLSNQPIINKPTIAVCLQHNNPSTININQYKPGDIVTVEGYLNLQQPNLNIDRQIIHITTHIIRPLSINKNIK